MVTWASAFNFLFITNKMSKEGVFAHSEEEYEETNLTRIFEEGIGSVKKYAGLRYDNDYPDYFSTDIKFLIKHYGKPFLCYAHNYDGDFSEFDGPKFKDHYSTGRAHGDSFVVDLEGKITKYEEWLKKKVKVDEKQLEST